MGDQFGHIKADTARAHDRNLLPDLGAAHDHVNIAHHLGMIDALKLRLARLNAGGHNDLIKALGLQLGGINAGVEAKVDAEKLNAPTIVAQGLVELFLARYAAGQIELTANFGGAVIERDRMASLSSNGGIGQTRRPRTDHGQAFGCLSRQIVQFGLMTGARIDQATGQAAGEGMVKTGLIAGDAGIDLVLAAFQSLQNQLGVGQHGPGHRDQVRIAARQNRLGHVGHIDPIAGDQGNLQLLTKPSGHLGKGRAGDHGGDGWDLGLVPAEVGGDDRCADRLNGLGQRHNLVPSHAPFEHIHGGNAENDDEVFAYRLAHAPHDLDREAHAVLKRPTPLVGALIGPLDEEGGEQIARRTDDLDPVIARLFGQGGAVGEIAELLFDALFVQLIGHVGGNAGADGRGGNTLAAPRQGPCMENLQADLHIGIGSVNRVGDLTMLLRLLRRRQLARTGFAIGANTAGDDHPDPAARAFCKIGRLPRHTAGNVLQARMHRAHQHAVL